MSPIQASLFDPALLTADGMPRDCPCCKGSGRRMSVSPFSGVHVVLVDAERGVWQPCKNCAGTGRAVIPY